MNAKDLTKTDFDERAKTWDDDPMKTARAQSVAKSIREQIMLSADMTGLEYGCGTGLLSFALQPCLRHITLADSSSGMLAVLQEKIAAGGIANMHPVKLDLTTDPLPEERFDIAYSLMTFHHIDDTDAILRDLHALLKTGGHLCVADLDSEDGTFHGAGFSGHKGFDRADLETRLRRTGFTNVRFSTVFNIRKGQPEKDYPVFLVLAEKT